MRIVVTALISAAMFSGPALAADQFDLVCKGEQTVNTKREPHEDRYRIDLKANRWCYQACEIAKPLKEATVDTLVLEREKGATATYAEIDHSISRNTGTVTKTISGGFGRVQFIGTCEPAPFSGLPAPKF